MMGKIMMIAGAQAVCKIIGGDLVVLLEEDAKRPPEKLGWALEFDDGERPRRPVETAP